MLDIPCIILAGGQSKRMGFDKALMSFKGYKTLSEFQLAKFSPYFKNIYISTKDSTKFSFQANFIEDLKEYQIHAPMIAIVSIFEKLKAKEIFVLSVDTPNFMIEHFYKLYNNHVASISVAKSPRGSHPLCAIYKDDVVSIFKSMIKKQDFKIQKIFDMIEVNFVKFENEEIFKNLNYQKDLI